MSNSSLWDVTLQKISEKVESGSYDLWVKPMRFIDAQPGSVTVEAPNRFLRDWIEENLQALIEQTLTDLAGTETVLHINIGEHEPPPQVEQQHIQIEQRKAQLVKKGIHLNTHYVFDSFVIGPSNQLASAAARRVAEAPGKSYNPFFVYGGVGLGKTHLVTAIGNEIVERHPGANVLYITSEQFINEVVSAFRHQKAEELKAKYRNLDVLIMDDVQYLENKTATQEELFHTFNSLYERQKQIVLSSDRLPREMQQMTDRLRSRFSMGLTVDIQPPEIETKVAIIHKKADALGLVVPEEVAMFVAVSVTSNIREIQGSLVRLGAHSSLTNSPVTIAMAKAVLKDLIKDGPKPLSIDGIIKSVCEYYGVKLADLKSNKRTKEIALPRQVAMYIARELTEASLADIGKALGGKDHATVIYACKKIIEKRKSDEAFDRMLEALKHKIIP